MRTACNLILLVALATLYSCEPYDMKPDHAQLDSINRNIILLPAKIIDSRSVEFTFFVRDADALKGETLVLQVAHEESTLTGVVRKTGYVDSEFGADGLKDQKNRATIIVGGLRQNDTYFARVRLKASLDKGKDSNIVAFKL